MLSPGLAGIIGALRSWTVVMISALSIPCSEVTPRVGVADLARDDVERDALVGELDGAGVAQLSVARNADAYRPLRAVAKLGVGGATAAPVLADG
jgi:hypothetical protein